MSQIHPTAIIGPKAQIGKNVAIGPYSIIHDHVTLEDGVIIHGHVYIDGNTTIGEASEVFPGAVIGTKPQDLKYRGETTYVSIGKNCRIRECVTINSSCSEGSTVKIGDNCLLMAYCHVAHNCEIGNRVIMSNNATLAGHVTIEDCAIISGLSAIHQFSRIGCYAMVGGMSRITRDVPPYTIGSGSPYRLGGLNLVGLKRNNFSLETRRELSQAFRLLFRSNLSVEDALCRIENELKPIAEIKRWVAFCRSSKRGLIGFEGLRAKNESSCCENTEAVVTC